MRVKLTLQNDMSFLSVNIYFNMPGSFIVCIFTG